MENLKAGQAEKVAIQEELMTTKDKLAAAVASSEMYKTVSEIHVVFRFLQLLRKELFFAPVLSCVAVCLKHRTKRLAVEEGF